MPRTPPAKRGFSTFGMILCIGVTAAIAIAIINSVLVANLSADHNAEPSLDFLCKDDRSIAFVGSQGPQRLHVHDAGSALHRGLQKISSRQTADDGTTTETSVELAASPADALNVNGTSTIWALESEVLPDGTIEYGTVFDFQQVDDSTTSPSIREILDGRKNGAVSARASGLVTGRRKHLGGPFDDDDGGNDDDDDAERSFPHGDGLQVPPDEDCDGDGCIFDNGRRRRALTIRGRHPDIRVGIGMPQRTSPGATLDVNGDARFRHNVRMCGPETEICGALVINGTVTVNGLPLGAGSFCWDLNGNGVKDLPDEDVNGDLVVDALDCQGPQGEQGPPGQDGVIGRDGLACWDLDEDGIADPEEDVNGDTVVDVNDCRGADGPQGDQGIQGIPGIDGKDAFVFCTEQATNSCATQQYDNPCLEAKCVGIRMPDDTHMFTCVTAVVATEACEGTFTKSPTKAPSVSPTSSPSVSPSVSPTKAPSESPTVSPSASPTKNPTNSPTKNPTVSPTKNPTESPSASPTKNPTASPSASPTKNPTESPTVSPSASPTKNPTESPSASPTKNPTESPSASPTKNPTDSPTKNPSASPTVRPTASPTITDCNSNGIPDSCDIELCITGQDTSLVLGQGRRRAPDPNIYSLDIQTGATSPVAPLTCVGCGSAVWGFKGHSQHPLTGADYAVVNDDQFFRWLTTVDLNPASANFGTATAVGGSFSVNIGDIAFLDAANQYGLPSGTLVGIAGGDYNLYTLDIVTGFNTLLCEIDRVNWGHAIAYNPSNGFMYAAIGRRNRGGYIAEITNFGPGLCGRDIFVADGPSDRSPSEMTMLHGTNLALITYTGSGVIYVFDTTQTDPMYVISNMSPSVGGGTIVPRVLAQYGGIGDIDCNGIPDNCGLNLGNLVVTNLAAPAQVYSGQRLSGLISFNITNTGTGNVCGPSYVRVVLSESPTGLVNYNSLFETLLGQIDVVDEQYWTAVLPIPMLSPGQTHAVTTFPVLDSSVGHISPAVPLRVEDPTDPLFTTQQYLLVQADYLNAVEEAPNTDNIASVPIDVVVASNVQWLQAADFTGGDQEGFVVVDNGESVANHWHLNPSAIDHLGGIRAVYELSETNPAWTPGDSGGSPSLGTDQTGYGNNWEQYIFKQFTNVPVAALLDVTLQWSTEGGYDFVFIEWFNLALGVGSMVVEHQLDDSSSIDPGTSLDFEQITTDLSAAAGLDIEVRIRFTSDGGYSDADAFFFSDGAVRVDEVALSGFPTSTFNTGTDGWASVNVAPGFPCPLRLEANSNAQCLIRTPDCGDPPGWCDSWVGYENATGVWAPAIPGGASWDCGLEGPPVPLPNVNTEAESVYILFDFYTGDAFAGNGLGYSFTVKFDGSTIDGSVGYWTIGTNPPEARTKMIIDITEMIRQGTFSFAQFEINFFDFESFTTLPRPDSAPYVDNVQTVVIGNTNAGLPNINVASFPDTC